MKTTMNRIITILRKPLTDTVARNVLRYGTGGLNIDASRTPFQSEGDKESAKPRSMPKAHSGFEGKAFAMRDLRNETPGERQSGQGRWPTNVILTGSSAELLDDEVGTLTSGKLDPHHQRNVSRFGDQGVYGKDQGSDSASGGKSFGGKSFGGDSGGPSRYFKVVDE